MSESFSNIHQLLSVSNHTTEMAQIAIEINGILHFSQISLGETWNFLIVFSMF